MAILHKSKKLHKELGLAGVYTLATGTTLSAGFFLLPGLAASEAGAPREFSMDSFGARS